MERFVNQFRGKGNQLPSSLASIFPQIEALWGGAMNQADFNGDGKDGNLDIGSGQRANYATFWNLIQSYGPAIASLMDNYDPTALYTANMSSSGINGIVSSGTYSASGSPNILHDFPDFPGASTTTAPIGGGASPSPAPGGGGGGGVGGGGGNPRGGPRTQGSYVHIEQHINGSLITQNGVDNLVNQAYGRSSRIADMNGY
jgi:hypothetical protein